MKISIIAWEPEHKIARITGDGMDTLSITKTAANEVALIWLRTDGRLNASEAKVVANALALAAKVAQYLNEYADQAAYDAILGLPTPDETSDPWDVNRERAQAIIWNESHPHPRAGRTEN